MRRPKGYKFAPFIFGGAIALVLTFITYEFFSRLEFDSVQEAQRIWALVVHFNIGVSACVGGLLAGRYELYNATRYDYAPRPRLLAFVTASFYALYYGIMSWREGFSMPALYLVDAVLVISCPLVFRRNYTTDSITSNERED